jgi:hypothetical protein
MTLTEKRKRAAVIAVSCYFENIQSGENLTQDSWSKMGITRIMSDTEMLLRRCKTPGIKN